MKHKKLFISLTAVCSVIVFLAIFLMLWYVGDSYPNFKRFNKEVEIPGIEDGAIPQGMGACLANYEVVTGEGEAQKTEKAQQQYFFISAYMKDHSPSRIYVTGEKTGYVGYVTLKTEDGEDFYGHCGGIAINNNPTSSNYKYYTLWVTSESQVYVARMGDNAKKSIAQEIVDQAAEHGSIQFTKSFKANCKADFCFYYDDPSQSSPTYDRLYVGEFYRSGSSETAETHRVTTPNGYANTAFMYEYNVSTSTQYGLTVLSNTENDLTEENVVPRIQKIFSIPEKIQGVAFSGRTSYGSNDGMMVLSESYALSNSHLLCFDYAKITANANRVTYSSLTKENFAYDGVMRKSGVPYTDSSLYLYYVDKGNKEMLVNDYSIPSMSEGMCVLTPVGSNAGTRTRIYVLFESAGKKYNVFVREQLKNVYSFIPRTK